LQDLRQVALHSTTEPRPLAVEEDEAGLTVLSGHCEFWAGVSGIVSLDQLRGRVLGDILRF